MNDPTHEQMGGDGNPCARYSPDHAAFVRQVLDVIADKWSLQVLVTLSRGPVRYGHVHSGIPGISQRMLTKTLTKLVEIGLVQRVAHAEVPPRVEYSLTALGETLPALVEPIIDWVDAHREEIGAHKAASKG